MYLPLRCLCKKALILIGKLFSELLRIIGAEFTHENNRQKLRIVDTLLHTSVQQRVDYKW